MAWATLDPAGPAARQILDLYWAMVVLGGVGFVVFLALLVAALRRRGRPDRDAPDDGTGRGRFRALLVGAGVIQPLLLITVTFALTLGAMRALPVPGQADDDAAVLVEVVGHQWWYEIRYPDLGVVTANELHLPVDRPVRLQLRSADVIHSFWVPRLAGKTDMFPDFVNEHQLVAEEVGTYLGHCAEFCGLQHTLMRIRAVVQPAEEFDEWVTARREPAAAPEGEIARRGQELFVAANCADCHTIAGTPADGRDGPDLTHLASRETLAAGTLSNATADLRAWVADPHSAKPGAHMPAADLDGEDLDALIAYLEGLE